MTSKVTFYGSSSLIVVTSGTTDISVKDDIYSGWKNWITSGNMNYLEALRTVGGDPTVSGSFLGSTFFLTNGWKLRSWEGTHELQVNGNLFVDGGGNPFVPTTGSHQVLITIQRSNLVDLLVVSGSGGSGDGSFTDSDRTALLQISSSITQMSKSLAQVSGTVANDSILTTNIFNTLSIVSSSIMDVSRTVLFNSSSLVQISSSLGTTYGTLLEVSGTTALSYNTLLFVSSSVLAISNSIIPLANAMNDLSASISDITSGSIAQAVWNEALATHSISGSTGKAFQEVGVRLHEIYQILGLELGNPMTVSQTLRSVAALSQSLSGDPNTSVTVTRLG